MSRRTSVQPSETAADRAYAVIRERILDGTLAGGALVSEGEFAADLQLSRTPVREAFLRLQAEGWMTLYPKRGALVRPVSPDEDREVLEARLLVETAAVHTASAASDDAAALAEDLTGILERQRDALNTRDAEAFARADVDFHQRVAASGNNGILTAFYGTLQDRQRRMTATTVHRYDGAPHLLLEQHEALTRAIADRDPDAFAALLRRHVRENRAT
ncbi:GntR family transcriptional regulator [Tersicoccus sp. MR15.9]|uniref:GntR family transcriptional regulator n=1 Tax=Tersicoccus mangrovi TaxID=3121635 RepID=UPI002FE5AD00